MEFTKMHCVYPGGLRNVLNACLSPKTLTKQIFEKFPRHDCLHAYLLAIILLRHCLCWHIAAFLGTLSPPVDQWNGVKPFAGVCGASPVCLCLCAWGQTKRETPFINTLLHSATSGHKLHRVLQFSCKMRGLIWAIHNYTGKRSFIAIQYLMGCML